MLTDTRLKSLRPKERLYKVADRDGMYVAVLPSGTVSFRYDYRINGRRETLAIGKYGPITLSEARERLREAKRLIEQGISPSIEKQRQKQQAKSTYFGDWLTRWFDDANYKDSTRRMIQGIIKRDVAPKFGKKLLSEITPDILRNHCDKVKNRGASASAVKTRDIVGSVFTYAKARGVKCDNPAEHVPPSTIATFVPRDRALSKKEIGLFFNTLKNAQTSHALKVALKIIMLTLVRKNSIVNAMWDEIDFLNAEWTIPAEKMKASRRGAGRPHVVYLSWQALDLFMQLHILAAGSPFVLPSFSQSQHGTIALSSLNRAANHAIQLAQKQDLPLEDFTIHDMRRTASTHLHEAGYNSDWIEKALAHEQRGVRAVYNKAEYAEQRRNMLQDRADMVDGWAGSL
ncbi:MULTISPECIES: tyrosine-type recombinase/integrase [unclassified Brenneria]|uniref:tyrosine-type recombinase/integrase n=1 Tax=unclassified Brenneria TaxID=2634434 RepID=UPI0018F0B60C|nr:integrase arm-type DNA-binding domain-containing protein [Brenneria sp. L3-3C-1]MBJ7223891.1 integrase arm-type DNA-binding domain-containing protein [Brenneria sp. L3-3C-1]MEE3645136.1 integrase arm-type DNA-binding domain-containing protein [Brenneria sp. L3_3C_1]